MVIGLIEDEDVVVAQHQSANDETGCFTAGEVRDVFKGVVAGEKHFSQDTAYVLVINAFSPLFEPVEYGISAFLIDHFRVVLREIADLHLVSELYTTFIERQESG